MGGSNLIEIYIPCFQVVWEKTSFFKDVHHKKLFLIKLKMILFLLFKLKLLHACYFAFILQEKFYIYVYMYLHTYISFASIAK